MNLPLPTDFPPFVADDPAATLSDAFGLTHGGSAKPRAPLEPARAAEADARFAKRLVGLFSRLEAHQRELRAAAAAGDVAATVRRAAKLVTELTAFAPTANDPSAARAAVRFITAADTVSADVGRGGLFRRPVPSAAQRDQCEWVLRDLVCVLGEHFRLMVAELHTGAARANWAELTEAFLADTADALAALEGA